MLGTVRRIGIKEIVPVSPSFPWLRIASGCHAVGLLALGAACSGSVAGRGHRELMDRGYGRTGDCLAWSLGDIGIENCRRGIRQPISSVVEWRTPADGRSKMRAQRLIEALHTFGQ